MRRMALRCNMLTRAWKFWTLVTPSDDSGLIVLLDDANTACDHDWSLGRLTMCAYNHSEKFAGQQKHSDQ